MAATKIKASDILLGTGLIPGAINEVGLKAIGVVATGSAAQTSPVTVWATVGYTGELFDTNDFHDTTTNNDRITIPSGLGGMFLIVAYTRFNGMSSGTLMQVRLTVNGTPTGPAYSQFSTGNTAADAIVIATALSLSSDAILRVEYRTANVEAAEITAVQLAAIRLGSV